MLLNRWLLEGVQSIEGGVRLLSKASKQHERGGGGLGRSSSNNVGEGWGGWWGGGGGGGNREETGNIVQRYNKTEATGR